MKVLAPSVLILLVLALGSSPMALGSSPAAFASHAHPTHFKATITGTFAFTSGSTIAASGKGTARPLGPITVTATVSLASNTGSPSVTMTTANGDKLFLTAVGTVTFTSSTKAVFSGTYTITGGSGHLARATGHGTLHVVADLTGSSGGTFTASLSGSIAR